MISITKETIMLGGNHDVNKRPRKARFVMDLSGKRFNMRRWISLNLTCWAIVRGLVRGAFLFPTQSLIKRYLLTCLFKRETWGESLNYVILLEIFIKVKGCYYVDIKAGKSLQENVLRSRGWFMTFYGFYTDIYNSDESKKVRNKIDFKKSSRRLSHL